MKPTRKSLVVLSLVVVCLLAISVSASAGRLQKFFWSDGVIQRADTGLDRPYCALVADGNQPYMLYGALYDGGLEVISSTDGSSFTASAIAVGGVQVTTQYAALAASTSESDVFYAARRSGGVDKLYKDGGGNWQLEQTGITGTYSSMAGDATVAEQFYAVKPDGGIDVCWNDGTYHSQAIVADGQPVTTTYNAVSQAPFEANTFFASFPNDVHKFYRTTDGVWHIFDTGLWHNYIALAGDYSQVNRSYAARSDGGMDILYWWVDRIVIYEMPLNDQDPAHRWTEYYNAVATATFENDVWYGVIGSLDIAGTINLEGYTGDRSLAPVRMDVKQNSQVVASRMLTLPADGSYSVAFRDLSRASYQISFSACKFLTKTVTADLSSGSVTLNVDLTNGDLDGNNSVGTTDFSILSSNFNKVGDQ